MQLSVTVRDNRLDSIETTISTAPLLRIYTGSIPSTCATAASGTLLAEMALPSDWMLASSSGSKAKSGTWQDLSANDAGTAGYFRIYNTAGSVCHIQGTVSMSGGGGDMILDNTSIAAGQTITITTFTLTDGNA